MANTESCKHIKMMKKSEESFVGTSPVSENEICCKKNEQFELSWPTLEERDLTQISEIQKEDQDDDHDDLKSDDTDISIESTFKEIGKVHHEKMLCNGKHDASSSLGPKFHFAGKKKRKIPIKYTDITDEPHQINHWNRLSDEIILVMFSFLTKNNLAVCAKVCKKWQRLGYDETLWFSMDLTGFSINESVFRKLLLRGIVVMRLAWAEIVPPAENEYSEESESSPESHYNLQYLDASSCNIKDAMLSDTISKSQILKKLSLESCCLSTGSLRAIGNCPHLSVLNLCMCTNLTKNCLRMLSKRCTRITELNLSWTNLTPESVNEVVKGFPSLIKLNLSGCRETLKDEAIEILLGTCKHLTNLDLSDCIVITDLSIKAIIQHNKMQDLSLSRCYGIGPKSLELFSSLKSIQSLQIFGFLTNPGIKLLEKCLPGVCMNRNMFSSIARPAQTLYNKRIWGIRCPKSHKTPNN